MILLLPFFTIFAVGYLLGSIPFGLLLTRAAGLGDVRRIGSGNIGATNVLRTGHKGLAAATLLLDALKGTAAVWIAFALLAPWLLGTGTAGAPASGAGGTAANFVAMERHFQGACFAGLGAFLGHIYPVWLGFRGGKGVATYIGVLVGLAPLMALVFCGIWLVVALVTRYSSLAALVASVCLPVILWAEGLSLFAVLFALMSVLLFWKHRENIARLLNGTESRIGGKSQKPAG
jgi:glycerol-3-phosphate acyltransferase PlsY